MKDGETMSFDKTIQLFIFDGNPNGRIMCELSNWNGRVYKVSRNEIAEFDKRADASHTGVYFLIGNDDDIPKYVEIAEFIISVGFIKHVNLRTKLYNKVIKAGGKLATIIASTAYVSKYATISEGTVIMHHAFVNAGAKVGKNVIINSFACIEHDSTIGDHCHISTGAIVNGGCVVGENVFIGSQSVLANNAVVGNNIIISAGSFVKNSITKQGLYFGNPAHIHT